MVKKYGKLFLCLLPFCTAVFLLFSLALQEAGPAKTFEALTFSGEYRQGDGPWQPLLPDSRISALKGDVVLRGSFSQPLEAGATLSVYLDHLSLRISLNGQEIAASDPETDCPRPEGCGTRWSAVQCPAIGTADTVEIALHNAHRYGNAGAYHAFLDNLYACPLHELNTFLHPQLLAHFLWGLLISVFAIGILGLAIFFTLMKLAPANRIWSMGLISLCMGLFLILDTADNSFLLISAPLVAGGKLLSIMMAMLELHRFLYCRLVGRSRNAAALLFCLHTAGLTALLGFALFTHHSLYSLLPVWAGALLPLALALAGCCICQWADGHDRRSISLLSAFLLLLAAAGELLLNFHPTFPHGTLIKAVFMPLFLVLLVRGGRFIASDYRKASQAEVLKAELHNSSIVMAMNQIRTHFIFNVLNAISGMCKYDPEKADQTVVRFSRYLRANVDVMQSDELMPFRSVLLHVEDYVALEQIRFGERLRFVTDIAAADFLFPPLILQPLVENAIKHGLNPKPHGGTVTLQTRQEAGSVIVRVSDDGVGFDPKETGSRSVGLKNVRFRLKHMARGTLHIESAPGRGTVCTISIPEKEVIPCE